MHHAMLTKQIGYVENSEAERLKSWNNYLVVQNLSLQQKLKSNIKKEKSKSSIFKRGMLMAREFGLNATGALLMVLMIQALSAVILRLSSEKENKTQQENVTNPTTPVTTPEENKQNTRYSVSYSPEGSVINIKDKKNAILYFENGQFYIQNFNHLEKATVSKDEATNIIREQFKQYSDENPGSEKDPEKQFILNIYLDPKASSQKIDELVEMGNNIGIKTFHKLRVLKTR